jgi:hypothetical protein
LIALYGEKNMIIESEIYLLHSYVIPGSGKCFSIFEEEVFRHRCDVLGELFFRFEIERIGNEGVGLSKMQHRKS